ncbi:hypothetical protein AFL94_02375 [Arthrobacter sp. LS16]|nr:hypothetical protein AFL94_02375 [Arthrobacter sp. LS16]
MRNAAHILADELDALRRSGTFGGESLVQQRVKALGMDSTTQYFSYLVENTDRVLTMLAQVVGSGLNLRGFETLKQECLNAIFMFQTGWGQQQAHGQNRVAQHTVHNLESLAALHSVQFKSEELEDARCVKIRSEVEALREFVSQNSSAGPNQAILLASIDDILAIIDAGNVDHGILSSKISALLGLLVLFAGAHEDAKVRERWFDRLKTGVAVLGTELFLTVTTDLGSIAVQNALGITQ